MAASNAALGKAHVPLGADGEGLYTAATLGCFNVIANAAPKVLESLEAVKMPAGAFRIADWGTADGGTSIPLMNRLVDTIKGKDADQEVEICYEDQPNADFKSLFFYVQGLKDLPNKETPYLKKHKGVYVSVNGTGFFDQGFPSSSIHLGVSFTAMHWLSAKPCNITTGIHMTQATGEEKEKFAAQAAKDWETILLARAAEMVPGGRMVLVNFTVDENGYCLGHSERGAVMYDEMYKHWKALKDAGKITQEELDNTTIINYYRTKEEMTAPFKEGTAVHGAGLRLISYDTHIVRCPYLEERIAEPSKRTAEEHAKWFVPTLRTWSNSSFTTALSDARPEAEKKALADEMFANYEAEVAKDPTNFHMDYCHGYLVIEKTAN